MAWCERTRPVAYTVGLFVPTHVLTLPGHLGPLVVKVGDDQRLRLTFSQRQTLLASMYATRVHDIVLNSPRATQILRSHVLKLMQW